MKNMFKLQPLTPPSIKGNLIGPEQVLSPEARKLRFRRLAGLLGGLHSSAASISPNPVPSFGPKPPRPPKV